MIARNYNGEMALHGMFIVAATISELSAISTVLVYGI